MLVFSKINKFHQFFHVRAIFGFLPIILISSTIPIRISLVSDEQTDIPNSVPLPILVPTELPRTVLPTGGQEVAVHTNFVQEEPLDLQCLTMV